MAKKQKTQKMQNMQNHSRKRVSVKVIMLGALILLLVPLVAMLFSAEWNWGIMDFVFAWVMFTLAGLSYKFLTRHVHSVVKRVAVAVIVFLVFLVIWGLFI